MNDCTLHERKHQIKEDRIEATRDKRSQNMAWLTAEGCTATAFANAVLTTV